MPSVRSWTPIVACAIVLAAGYWRPGTGRYPSGQRSTGFAEIRALNVPSRLPVAVLIGAAGLTDTANPDRVLFKTLQIRHQGDWVL